MKLKWQQEPVAAVAWQQGYDQGVADERISEANIGIAGFGAKVNPARNNPYTSPQPAQQEPVATITITQRGPIRIIDNNFDDCVRGWPDGEYNLYTFPQPAQRTWVGLTDEEIDKIPCELYAPDQGGMTMEEGLQVYARAIEAKLKEKNT